MYDRRFWEKENSKEGKCVRFSLGGSFHRPLNLFRFPKRELEECAAQRSDWNTLQTGVKVEGCICNKIESISQRDHIYKALYTDFLKPLKESEVEKGHET